MPAPKYPWDNWFRKKKFRLTKPEDYTCSQSSIVQAVRNNAATRGVRVAVIDEGNEIEVTVKGAA